MVARLSLVGGTPDDDDDGEGLYESSPTTEEAAPLPSTTQQAPVTG